MCMMCVDHNRLNGPFDMHVETTFAAIVEGASDAPSEISGIAPTFSAGDTFQGSLSIGDVDVIGISLVAGDTYAFEISAAQAGPSVADTFLRVYTAEGAVVGSNDDIDYTGGNFFSGTSVTANYTGMYYVEVQSYETHANASNATDAGGYTLSALNNGVMQEFSVAEVADQLTDEYWSGGPYHWAVTPGQSIDVNISALNSDGQFFANTALAAWTSVTGLQFNTVSSGGDIVVDDEVLGSAYANFSYDGSNNITSATINVGQDWILGEEGRLDSYSLQTYIHEFGHALGLGHAGSYNGSATYGVDNHFLNDSWQISIMSYFDQVQNTYVSGDRAFAITPMMADILAMQALYGTAGTLRATDTVYGENGTAGMYLDQIAGLQDAVTYTIFDDGGVDTLDFGSSVSHNVIDLRGGTYSNINGVAAGLAIYTNSVIENVILGAGNDNVTGNNAANRVTLGAGVNVSDGSFGADTAVFAAVQSAYTITQISLTEWSFSRVGEHTTLTNFETAEFADGSLQLQGSDPIAEDDSFVLLETGTVQGNVQADNGSGPDSDGDGDPLTITLLNGQATLGVPVTLASGASLTLNIDGTFDYDPGTVFLHLNFGETAFDGFTYTLTDGGATSVATVTFTINGAAPAPSAGNDTLYGVAQGTSALDGLAGDDIMVGRVGFDDTLWGNAGNDQIFGESGLDLLVGEGGTDFIYGGDGADIIYGDQYAPVRVGSILTPDATDALFGQDGGDTIYGGGGGDGINGGAGIDTLYGEAGVDWIYGGTEGDFIYGGDDGDALFGQAGDDEMYGEAGDDSLDGGWGHDELFGGAGIDFIYGGIGNDILHGGDDTDSMQGEAGNDTLNGGAGDDGMDGGYDNDTLSGDAGVDWIYGGFGNDILYGHNAGADGTETDALFGQEGDDILIGGGGGDSLDGGADNDQLDGGAGNDWMFGQSGNDLLDGGADSDVIFAGDGADDLRGGSGGDSLDGGAGDDLLNGGIGVDVLFGGSGSDTFIFDDLTGTGDVVRDFVTGTDSIRIHANAFGVTDLVALAANTETGAGLPASFATNGPILYIETFWNGLWIDPDGGNASNMINIFGMETGSLAFSDIEIVA